MDQQAGLEAVREAFVNLLVHTDYQETNDALIEHRDDGYRFRNPGDSWVDPRDLGFQSRSERRNPIIAQLFDNIGLADQAGSGFIRILDEWRELGYRKPTIVSDSANYSFELDLNLAAMLSLDDRGWLATIGGPWREEEELALVFARHDGAVDNQTLRGASGQHLFDASKTLGSLRDRGYLILHGSGRNARYELGSAALTKADSAPSKRESGHLRTDSGHLGLESGQLQSQSGHLGPESGRLTLGSGHTEPAEDKLSILNDRLHRIAAPIAESGRSTEEEIQTVLLILCAITPLSTTDLEHLLKRKHRTLRRHVATLVQEGKLQRIAGTRTHPERRYRTVQTLISGQPQGSPHESD